MQEGSFTHTSGPIDFCKTKKVLLSPTLVGELTMDTI